MPIFEYECHNCGITKEIICRHYKRPKYIKCECRSDGILFTLMKQKIPSGSFVVNGFNEKNGYSMEVK